MEPKAHKPAARHLLLIGLRGSGKSTVAPLLAQSLGAPCIDLDQQTLALLGCDTVTQAWREHGEPMFRQKEARALQTALNEPPSVIAAGGGTPITPAAQSLIRSHQQQGDLVVVYLRADPATLRARLETNAHSDDRPSLTGADPLTEIETVHAARHPLYSSLADFVLESAGQSSDTVAAIMIVLSSHKKSPSKP